MIRSTDFALCFLRWPIEPFGPRQTGDQRGLVVAQEWLSGGEQSTLLMNDCAGARRSGPGRSSSAPEELMPIQAKGQVRAFAFAFAFLASATLFHTIKAVLYMRSPCMQEEFPFFAIFGQLPWQQEAVSC